MITLLETPECNVNIQFHTTKKFLKFKVKQSFQSKFVQFFKIKKYFL